MDTTEQVKGLLNNNFEVRDVHDSLKDKWERETFTEFLDDMLNNHNTIFGPNASTNDYDRQSKLVDFSTTARSLAKKYVDQPLWHTPWLTRYLLDEVLEGQCTYLGWMAIRGIYPEWHLRHFLRSPYRTFVPPLVSVAFFLFYLWALYWLTNKEYFVAAALLGAFMLYFYLIAKPLTWWRRRKNRALFISLAQLFVTPLYEIRSTNYDPETISRRLQACEQKDLQVASIAFALLKLPSNALSESHTS
jgi:hypothetical protein